MNTQDSIKRPRKNIGVVRPVVEPAACSLEAELSTLGGLILDNRAWPDVSGIVQQEDFHEEKNRVLFRAIQDLAAAGKPFDAVTILDELERTGRLADAGGATWIGQVGRDTPSAANVIHYAQVVRRKALERQRAASIDKGDHERAAELTAAIKDLEAGTSASALLADYVPVSSLDSQSFTRTYLVEGLIEKGRVYEFFGKYKEGKTLAVIDMVANLSMAQTWAKRRTAQALVVWVAGEAVDDVQMRIAAWRLRHRVTAPMPFYIRTKPVYMTDQQFASRLVREIEALQTQHPGLPVLLVLDTVARCMAPGADENSIIGLGAFANNLLDIVVRPLQATAICVHHSGHGDSDRGRGHSSFEGAVDGIIKVSMDRSRGQPVITVAASRTRSTAGDDSLSFRIEVQELPGQDNFGYPIDAPVLHHLEGYAVTQKIGKHEKAAIAILNENGGSMLVGDLRKATQELIRAENAKKGYLEVSPGTLKSAWSRTLRDLTKKGLVVESGDGKTVSLPNGLQRLQKGCMQPNATEGEEGLQRLHTPIGVQPCNHPATGSGSHGIRQDTCMKCHGTGELEIGGRAGVCMACAGRGYVDLFEGAVQPLAPESMISEFHGRRGTTGAGGRVAKVVAFPNATATGNRSDGNTPPDYGSSDDSYYTSMPEFQSGAAPAPEPPPALTETVKADCRHCRRHAPHARTCKAMNLYCDPLLEPLCAGRYFEPGEGSHD